MMHTNALYQLGRFVVMFQRLESEISELLVLLAHADDEAIRILITELGFAQRVRTANTLFSRFVDLQKDPDQGSKVSFSKLSTELLELAARRNTLVHSNYSAWINIGGASGLLRSNSKLRRGAREKEEETLLAEGFEPDIQRAAKVAEQLESFRLYAIACIYPDSEA